MCMFLLNGSFVFYMYFLPMCSSKQGYMIDVMCTCTKDFVKLVMIYFKFIVMNFLKNKQPGPDEIPVA